MGMQKVYTKTGDKGMTSLVSGEKVHKTDLRVEAYGCVDELNAHIGVLCEALRSVSVLQSLIAPLTRVQHTLFDIGSELACRGEGMHIAGVQEATVEELEKEMDQWALGLTRLTRFVLPGGHLVNAQAHVARTVCRRAERQVLRVAEVEAVRGEIVRYLNRLSDWFFVLSRWIVAQLGCEETFWMAEK
jgi:cob(I)alamin adenosyltransferase